MLGFVKDMTLIIGKTKYKMFRTEKNEGNCLKCCFSFGENKEDCELPIKEVCGSNFIYWIKE